MFEGSGVALVTPMTTAGEIDEKKVVDLVEWHIAEGTTAIVVAGTTGEGATLTPIEQMQLWSIVKKVAKGRLPIIAGTGSHATASTIETTRAAAEIGVDGCLVVTPYYNRPSQNGLIQHFTAIAQASSVPILLYNVPKRTACDLLPETVGALSRIPNIVGIKEATGDMQRLEALQAVCQSGFLFYSGDDPTALDFMLLGGKGVISITANVAPKLMQNMCRYALAQAISKARAVDNTLQSLHRMMLVEANPIPVKWALQYLGKIEGGIRLPLTPLAEEFQDKVKQALNGAGIYCRQTGF